MNKLLFFIIFSTCFYLHAEAPPDIKKPIGIGYPSEAVVLVPRKDRDKILSKENTEINCYYNNAKFSIGAIFNGQECILVIENNFSLARWNRKKDVF